MESLRHRVEQVLRQRICSVCVEALADGSCGLPKGFLCPLFQRLDDIIAVVAEKQGDQIDPYVQRLREIVCTTCSMDEKGVCDHRNQLSCALDMYFPLVIELIEKELVTTR